MSFVILSLVMIAGGAGLMTIFAVTSQHAKWIGYQTIFGLGTDFGFQQYIIAAQAVPPLNNIPF